MSATSVYIHCLLGKGGFLIHPSVYTVYVLYYSDHAISSPKSIQYAPSTLIDSSVHLIFFQMYLFLCGGDGLEISHSSLPFT